MRSIVIILFTLVFTVSGVAQVERSRLDTLRAEGYDALYNLDYDGARKHFQKMIDVAPDHPAGAQCFASSLWIQHLNEAWELKATLYSTDTEASEKKRIDRKQVEEFHKWIRRAKALAEARLRKNPKDIESLYFLGAAKGLEAAFAGSVEHKYTAALRTGSASVDHHRDVLKLAPEFRDAELTIGLQNYIIGSLSLPLKMLVATMGVRGSKKRGLEALERVADEGHWARDMARVLLIDLYKREKRWNDSVGMARALSEKYPRNYLFKLQMADALVSQILTLRKQKTASGTEEKEVLSIFAAMFRDRRLDASTIDVVHFRFGEALLALGQPEAAAKEFTAVVGRAGADAELKTMARGRLDQIRKR